MSYIRLFENVAVLEQLYLKGTYREPKWDLTGTCNGAFKRALKCKFERQFSLVNLLGESGAHEAPYVALLIRVSRARPGESGRASHIAAPLETR